jgi:tRNA A37 threonylcarbamoyladenosine dehydratase
MAMLENDHLKTEDTDRRFDRLLRLVGPEGLARLRAAHVMVVGCGGVGSWAAEAVTRSAFGRVTVVDFDTVCIRNFNRQLQATDGTVGKLKVEVLAERLRLINPQARIDAVSKPFSEESHAELMKDRPDFVIDAIDHITSKCFLIDYCRKNSIPLIVSSGSAGRLDPTQIRVMDLGRTELDPLAKAIRKILRKKYAFPRNAKFGVPTVCSLEPALEPHDQAGDSDCKAGCVCPGGQSDFQCCVKKSVVLGTSCAVTAAFGMACAAEAVRRVALPAGA